MSPLPEAADKRAVVEAMFDRIAGDYDRMNRLMTFGIDRSWRRLAIERLGLRRGDRVLDLGCGTGDLARLAAAAGARVVGVDVSAGMLAVASAQGLRSRLVRAAAEALPIADRAVDAVVSGFALRNLSDLDSAFAELGRVLRPGGALSLLEVDLPKQAWLRFGHRLYFEHWVPRLGRWLADREAYEYLPSSVVYLPPEAELMRRLEAAGFGEVAKEPLLGGAAQLVTARRAR